MMTGKIQNRNEPGDAEGWSTLTHEEKNRVLYERQKHMLQDFLDRGAISEQQYEKSLHDLTEKMGFG